MKFRLRGADLIFYAALRRCPKGIISPFGSSLLRTVELCEVGTDLNERPATYAASRRELGSCAFEAPRRHENNQAFMRVGKPLTAFPPGS